MTARAPVMDGDANTYAGLHRQLDVYRAERDEALAREAALADVMALINASPGDIAPVFDTILDRAMRLCDAAFGVLWTYDGERVHATSLRGVPPAFSDFLTRAPHTIGVDNAHARLLRGEAMVHIADVAEEKAYESGDPIRRTLVDLAGGRSLLAVPLRKDGVFLGDFVIYRQEVRPFSDRQIALLQNFAAQAVIAMENARLLGELREALAEQTATAEVLQVINASPGRLEPVFNAMIDKATRRCQAEFGGLLIRDGDVFRLFVGDGSGTERPPLRPDPGSALAQMVGGAAVVHISDVADTDEYRARVPSRVRLVEDFGARTTLFVALRKDDALLGVLTIYRREVRPFTDRQIALVRNFAAQAVIAIETARLLNELRGRTEELRITFENMGDGVALFDGATRLVAWNHRFQDIFSLPDAFLSQHHTYEEHLRFLAARGDYSAGVDPNEQIRQLITAVNQSDVYERTRPDGRVLEIRRNPVPGGGFVLIFSDITERKRNEAEIRASRDAAEAAYRELKATQASLVQAEKMASLGQLTAGIAHEIKNPLNFVNNFAELSADLLDELNDAVSADRRAELDELTTMLKGNLTKIAEHGRRADSIVKNMLLHSRSGPSEHRPVDLNAAVEEAANLAYHGARAETSGFNIVIEQQLDPRVGVVDLFPQEFARVMLNLIGNAFYAARQRADGATTADFQPTVRLTTSDLGDEVEIRVRDNGTGISEAARDRIFEPFFTTKPAGEGTGLGLSLSYDIIVNQHGGQLSVDSRIGEFTEFRIALPRRMPTIDGGQP